MPHRDRQEEGHVLILETMAQVEAHSMSPEVHGLLAPRWHTALFIALLLSAPLMALVLSLAGQPLPAAGTSRLSAQYLPFLVTEWGLVLLLWLGGLRPCGVSVVDVVAVRPGARQLVADLVAALIGWLVVIAIELVWPSHRAATVLPVTGPERLMWIPVALTAATAEELIFRGYLQRQLAALTGSVVIGVLAQAVLFGIVHGEQGVLAAVKIGVYGLGLGLMAHQRGGLRAAMICHAGIDLVSGLFHGLVH